MRAIRELPAVAKQSFNEAEARAPRMQADDDQRAIGDTGFNEAEARAPRMPQRATAPSSTVNGWLQ